MKVGFVELANVAVEKMVVVAGADVDEGQCVGYRCQRCGEADETLEQVYHKPDCPLTGRHGRAHYGDGVALDASADGRRSAELEPEHPLWLVESAETDPRDDVYNGEIVAVRCRCGNLDDDLFAIVHDEACPLADADAELETTDVAELDGVAPGA